MVWGAVAGLVVVGLAVAGVVYVGSVRPRSGETLADRALIVVASRGGQDGSEVAQLIAVADESSGKLALTLVDPGTTVTVPGTSVQQLRDAYPFGGPRGVAEAYAAVSRTSVLPAIALDQRALETIVDREGGVTVTVPAATNVFDGKNLYRFDPGMRHLHGIELSALLAGTESMTDPGERSAVRASIATGILDAVRSSTPMVSDLVTGGHISTTLRSADLSAAGERFARGLAGYALATAAR